MRDALSHLARLYQLSAHGRREGVRDFSIDYESFLRQAGMDDGDARELAERELAELERESNGLLHIDRHRRSGMPERLRLLRDGGESWLFSQLSELSPSEQRAQLATFFQEMAANPPCSRWHDTWIMWLLDLAKKALLGESVQPFRRNDAEGNRQLIDVLSRLLVWSTPCLIRYASVAICGDSKALQRWEPRLRPALLAITGRDSLESFGIMPKPRFVTFHGPLLWQRKDQSCDFSVMVGPVTLAETNLDEYARLHTNASIVLTVENEDTFHELVASNPGVLLVLTSYAGAAVRKLLGKLSSDLIFYHFGDRDAAGADILRDLREKTQRDIQLLVLLSRSKAPRQPLREVDEMTLMRLLNADIPDALRCDVMDLLENGVSSDFEQESVPIAEVWQALSAAVKETGKPFTR